MVETTVVTSSRLSASALPLVGLLIPLGACRPATTARAPEPVPSTDAPVSGGALDTSYGVLDKRLIRNVVRGHIGPVTIADWPASRRSPVV